MNRFAWRGAASPDSRHQDWRPGFRSLAALCRRRGGGRHIIIITIVIITIVFIILSKSHPAGMRWMADPPLLH